MIQATATNARNIRFLGFELAAYWNPIITMILIAILVPNSSFLGHFFGLMAAFMLKFCFLHVCLPKRACLEKIEIFTFFNYIKIKEAVNEDFKSPKVYSSTNQNAETGM